MTGRRSRLIFFLVAAVAAAAIVAAVAVSRQAKSRTAQAAAPPSVPVTVIEAAQQDVPIYYDALGTVQAFNTVAIRAQINGQLVSINFRQGQDVRKGDALAKIDPALYQATLDQAIAKRSEDEAQLIDAQKDLARFKTLVLKDFETQQNVDAQQAKVDLFKATIAADQGAIEAAQTQLNYTNITAPIDGVVGFRQVDLGNIIHTNDVSPLTVLTQIKPCVTVFTLPQDDLGPVREAMLRGSVDVLAFDQNDVEQLAQGRLLLIDNQIDQSTSTIRLKAEFPNQDERLWPGEFVRIRILVTTRKNAVTIPPVAVQRGPDGLYVWVIKPDNTAEQRPIDAQTVSDSTAVVSKGLTAGERVVVDGQSRLEAGSHVDIRPASQAQHEADKT
ncbi:MAG: efflux RND transporter periplasmic adaptor subunit [Xanthobacteraceae bacterium]